VPTPWHVQAVIQYFFTPSFTGKQFIVSENFLFWALFSGIIFSSFENKERKYRDIPFTFCFFIATSKLSEVFTSNALFLPR
jgi:hypothetical protein